MKTSASAVFSITGKHPSNGPRHKGSGMRAVFVFCEGPHDIAFLGRLLVASKKYKRFRARIKSLHGPTGIYRFIDYFYKYSLKTATRRSRSTVLPGMRRVGKTEIFTRDELDALLDHPGLRKLPEI